MAYNHGREERKWRIWKENEEKILRECGVDESVIEEIRIYDRADFNSNRRFYRWTNDVAEYLEEMADREPQARYILLRTCLMKSKTKRCIRRCLRWTGTLCIFSCSKCRAIPQGRLRQWRTDRKGSLQTP